MAEATIRPATRADLARLTEIYNYYVINTPVTFDLERALKIAA
jgi:L-amino acid N-acyltransferase YncA